MPESSTNKMKMSGGKRKQQRIGEPVRKGPDLSRILLRASRAAAAELRKYYRSVAGGNGKLQGLISKQKVKDDPRTLVTEADRRSERVIVRLLSSDLKCDFLTEESGFISSGSNDSHFRVIVDPLDGSMNFAHETLGLFGVAVAVEAQGRLVAGALTLPQFDQIMVGERGFGAVSTRVTSRTPKFRRIPTCVGRAKTLAQARICLGRGSASPEILSQAPMIDVISHANEIVNFASCTVGLWSVIRGSIDGLMLARQQYWDFAAGIPIVLEVGGSIGLWEAGWRRRVPLSDLSAADATSCFDLVVTGNRKLFAELEDRIRGNRKASYLS